MVWQNIQCTLLQAICSSLAAIVNDYVMTTNKSLQYSLLLMYHTLALHFMLSLLHLSLPSNHALRFYIFCLAGGCTPGNFSLYAAITCGDLLLFFNRLATENVTTLLQIFWSHLNDMKTRRTVCKKQTHNSVYKQELTQPQCCQLWQIKTWTQVNTITVRWENISNFLHIFYSHLNDTKTRTVCPKQWHNSIYKQQLAWPHAANRCK